MCVVERIVDCMEFGGDKIERKRRRRMMIDSLIIDDEVFTYNTCLVEKLGFVL